MRALLRGYRWISQSMAFKSPNIFMFQFYGRKIEKHLILKEFESTRQEEGSDEAFSPPPLSEVSNKRIFLRILGVTMVILDVWGLTFIFTECVGFLSQICAFTLMGIIVNASAVLKYVTLVIMVVLYR